MRYRPLFPLPAFAILVSLAAVNLTPTMAVASTKVKDVRAVTAASPKATPSVSCPINIASTLQNSGGGSQLITVTTTNVRSTFATLETWARVSGCWQPVAGPLVARIGRSGMSAHHREGDGTTPMGLFGFGPTLYGNNAQGPGGAYPYVRLTCGDWWDEKSTSKTYNSFVHVPCGTNPAFNDGQSEALWLERTAYSSFAVIAYNPSRIAGLGSGIFLHATTNSPTAGCVSLPLVELRNVLRWMVPSSSPHIVIEVVNR
jgi:L,D-peptidoglycan transpeptidase YkuD (ErfK/YbiS/YcfS/YnhG family)